MGKRSTKAIRIALKKFATGSNAYDSAYTSAMQRIESQVPDQVELAKQVLAWIVHAKSQITADELQEALGVEPDEEYFDRDNCPDVDDMVSACAGLVRIDEGTNTIQLVHYTTQEYFERTRHNWFPYAEAMIATTCMAYLSLDQFETLSGLELYKYASLFWGLHARSAQDTLAQVMKFLQRSVQVEQNGDFIHRHHNVELGGTADRKVRRTTALHLAAYFGLEEVAGTFDDLSTYDQSNSEGVTPIMYAAMRNHESVLKLLLARDTSLQCSHAGISPLYLAAYNGHLAIVHLLLGHDPPGQAEDGVNDPLVGAARNGHESIVKLLVKRYVWPSARDTRVLCALLYAARAGHDSTAEYLFETGPGNFVNFAKALESTHLHQAAEQEFKNVLQLLRKGSKQSKSRTTNISTSQESANLLRNLLESDVPSVEFMGDDDGLGTPMRQAAAKGRLGMGKALIELGAEINDQSSTALWLAVEGGYDDFINLLWEHCGDVSIRHVMFQRVLCGALCQKSVYSRAVKALVGTGIDLSRQFYGETAIQIAFRRGHLDAAKVLLEAGVNVDQQDADNGQTLLFTMTLLENRAGVKLLASGGANPNLCNMHGRSPLHVAAKHHKFGYLTIIESLVKAGAELDKRDDWGTTPLHLGCRFRSYGCEKIVKFLLDAGADVNHQDDLGQSPLHMACTNGHTKLVKLLLDHGANVRCSDKHGNTPLHVACRWEDGVPVKMVLDSGSDVSCRIRLGDSPLHQGRWESHEAVVRMLLDAGANVTSQDSKGSTALDDARDQGHGDIVKLLLERGVNEECPARAVKTLPVRLKSDELRHTTTPVSEVLTT
jgi:ankyrin repeat protein